MACLRLLNGFNPGQVFTLEGDCAVMGRHPECDFVLEMGAVSRQHAQILHQAGKFFAEDLNSRNGTYVNGQRIEGRHELADNDRIRICDLEFTFHLGQPGPLGVEPGMRPDNQAMMVDDPSGRSTSTIMSKIDVTVGDSGIRAQVKPEAKLKALFEITNNLRTALQVEQVLPKIIDSLFTIFVQADRGFIVLRDGERLIPKAVRQRRGDDDTVRISRTIVNQVMDTREAILSADAASDSRFDMSQSIADFRIRSMMCAPLLNSEGDAMGILQLDALDTHGRFHQDDLDVLVSVGDQAAFAIENAQLHERALKQQAVERDLELAHEVQRGLLPRSRPEVEGYEFFDYYEPANQVGGDYFGYQTLPDGRFGVVLADVAGKGVAAALVMARLSSEVRHCVLAEPDAGAAINRLARGFDSETLDGRFVTMALVVVDPKNHQLTIANAGHMPPYLRHRDGRVGAVAGEEAGVPLGVAPEFEYDQCTLSLEPGDSIVVFTDGINEAMNVANQQYGLPRIEKNLTNQLGGVEAVGNHLLDDVKRFVGDREQFDDMCLVCFGRV